MQSLTRTTAFAARSVSDGGCRGPFASEPDPSTAAAAAAAAALAFVGWRNWWMSLLSAACVALLRADALALAARRSLCLALSPGLGLGLGLGLSPAA